MLKVALVPLLAFKFPVLRGVLDGYWCLPGGAPVQRDSAGEFDVRGKAFGKGVEVPGWRSRLRRLPIRRRFEDRQDLFAVVSALLQVHDGPVRDHGHGLLEGRVGSGWCGS